MRGDSQRGVCSQPEKKRVSRASDCKGLQVRCVRFHLLVQRCTRDVSMDSQSLMSTHELSRALVMKITKITFFCISRSPASLYLFWSSSLIFCVKPQEFSSVLSDMTRLCLDVCLFLSTLCITLEKSYSMPSLAFLQESGPARCEAYIGLRSKVGFIQSWIGT